MIKTILIENPFWYIISFGKPELDSAHINIKVWAPNHLSDLDEDLDKVKLIDFNIDSDDCGFRFGECELLVDGFIKWDGCAHLTFGDAGYIHICGKDNAKSYADMLYFLFELAECELGKC